MVANIEKMRMGPNIDQLGIGPGDVYICSSSLFESCHILPVYLAYWMIVHLPEAGQD